MNNFIGTLLLIFWPILELNSALLAIHQPPTRRAESTVMVPRIGGYSLLPPAQAQAGSTARGQSPLVRGLL